MGIADQIKSFNSQLTANAKLVAVSKTKPNSDILEAYQAGQRIFGENKVQELTQKYQELPKDIEWHFIGHLQTNKVKYIAPFISLFHAVDSLKLLQTMDKEGKKNNRVLRGLLQFHVAQEESKFGLNLMQAKELLESDAFAQLTHVKLVGAMGMATYTDDTEQVRQEFRQLKQYFDELKSSHFANDEAFCELSMGMSGDYDIAMEEGSTLIRVGSSIFGTRSYT